MNLRYRALHVIDECLDILCARVAAINNEIRVFAGNLGATDFETLQTCRFYQPRGMVALRISENGAATWQAEWLCVLSTGHHLFQHVKACFNRGVKLEQRFNEPFVGVTGDPSIGNLLVIRCALVDVALPVDRRNRTHTLPRFAARRPGVHCQCTANGSGYGF